MPDNVICLLLCVSAMTCATCGDDGAPDPTTHRRLDRRAEEGPTFLPPDLTKML